MDEMDGHILHILKENSRTTVSQISKQVNLSIPAVSERIRKLEEQRVIEQYTIRVNRHTTGLHLMALVFVNLASSDTIQTFRSRIIQLPEVLECHHLAGEYDYMLKVLVHHTHELEQFLSEQLKVIPGVQKTNTTIVLSTLKEESNRLE